MSSWDQLAGGGAVPASLKDLPRRVHRLGDDKETEMPRGIYDRSTAKPRGTTGGGEQPAADTGAAKPGKKPLKRKRARRAAASTGRPVSGPRFGVFDDGSVQINTEHCQGHLSTEEANALRAFMERKAGAGK